MTRRRLLLIAVVGLAAVTVLWANAVWSQHRLEQQLVGKWKVRLTGFEMEFLPNGQWRHYDKPPSSYWSVSGQNIIFSDEPQWLPHAVWPLAALIGWRPNGLTVTQYDLRGEQLTISSGQCIFWGDFSREPAP